MIPSTVLAVFGSDTLLAKSIEENTKREDPEVSTTLRNFQKNIERDDLEQDLKTSEMASIKVIRSSAPLLLAKPAPIPIKMQAKTMLMVCPLPSD